MHASEIPSILLGTFDKQQHIQRMHDKVGHTHRFSQNALRYKEISPISPPLPLPFSLPALPLSR